MWMNKDVCSWNYKNLNEISLHRAWHQIVLDTGGLPTDHLQGIGWITLCNSSETWFWSITSCWIHQTGWTSLDLEISSPKENGKLQICNDFWYPLPWTDEVLDTMARHGVYSFFDGFCGYHQILNRWTLSSALAVNISFMMWMMLYLPLTPCPALHSPESPQLEMPATGACLCPEDCNQAWNPRTLSKYMVIVVYYWNYPTTDLAHIL